MADEEDDSQSVATLPSRDSVGAAIKSDEVAFQQRNTAQENRMFGGPRAIAPIDPSGPDTIGAAIKQNDASFVQRNTLQRNQMFGGSAAPQLSPEQLMDAAIDAKRADIAARQSTIQSQLPSTSGKYRDKLVGEFTLLQHSDALLQRDQHQRALMKLHLSDQDAKTNHETQLAGYGAEIRNFFENIDTQKYPLGSTEREQYIGKTIASRPDWIWAMHQDPETGKYVRSHLDAHEKVSDTVEKLKGLGYTAEPSRVGPEGTSYTIRKSGDAPKNAIKEFSEQVGLVHPQLKPGDFGDQAKWQPQIDEKTKQPTGNMFLEVPTTGGGKSYITIPGEDYKRLKDQHDVLTGKTSSGPSGNPRSGGNVVPDDGDVPKQITKADYDKLPSGSTFVAPDGTTRRKP